MKINFDKHTNIKGVIVIALDNTTYKCNGIIANYSDLLEVGNKFDIGGHNLTLVRAEYNPENHGVYYEFESKKEAF